MKTISFGAATGRSTRMSQQKMGRRAVRRWLKATLSRIAATLDEWRRRRRDRADLAALDDRMLRDIGISRADVWLEINKPFWRE